MSIDQYPVLFGAIKTFLYANSSFESSIPVNCAIDDIGKATDLQNAFVIPIQRQLFPMETAMKWVLFLTLAPPHAEKFGEQVFGSVLNAHEALKTIGQIYDIAVVSLIYDNFEEDSSDEEEEDKKM